ncbi:hypothetical protein GOBAR_AA12459 [Gossypium barbadense]|uniref:Uncharacterized protein n=1 Tax=Gossypium barbadense TaxID=3634 RepID=A0A2P5XY16_GOSBA|nr:hypothetical protein GOBAR_AA12459 [Gossypium barbadense]
MGNTIPTYYSLVRQLEEMRGSHGNCNYNRSPSPRSSSASTPSTGTLGSTCTEGHPSSIDFSPTAKSLEKYCRPIDHVMVETQLKGTLLHRLDQVEDRLLKLEEELEEEKKREAVHVEKKGHKKGIKQFEEKRTWIYGCFCVGPNVEGSQFSMAWSLLQTLKA